MQVRSTPSSFRATKDTPPTHLQEDKRADEHPESQALMMARELTIVDIDEIGEPGDGGPH